MSGIKFECKKAIGKINKLIKFYKPIDADSVLDFEYRQQMKIKVDDFKECLHMIMQLDNTIISNSDYEDNLLVDFDIFGHVDEFYYNNGMFLNELFDLKEKIKKGVDAMDANAIKKAEIKLDNIISHTNNLTLNDWMNEDIQYDIKAALSQFVEFVRNNKLDEMVDDLKDFDGIIDYCIDEEARDDKFVLFVLQKILPIMKKDLSAVKLL